MIIKLIFDQSNAPASFTSAVESAALMLEKAITDPITVTIEVGYGRFPTDNSLITNGAAEGEPADGSSFLYSELAALSAGKAPGDTNFDALPTGGSIRGFNGSTTQNFSSVLVYPAQEKPWVSAACPQTPLRLMDSSALRRT
jgi:hypothetical protein